MLPCTSAYCTCICDKLNSKLFMCEWVIERNVGWAAPHYRLPDKVVTLPLNHWLTYVINQNQLYMSIYPVIECQWVSHWQKLIKICNAHCQQYLCEQYTTAVYSSWDVVRKTASVTMAPLDLYCTKCTCIRSSLLVALTVWWSVFHAFWQCTVRYVFRQRAFSLTMTGPSLPTSKYPAKVEHFYAQRKF